MSGTLRVMRLALFALLLVSLGLIARDIARHPDASLWWQLPAGGIAGYAVSMVIWCVIPPRFPPPWPLSRLIAILARFRRGAGDGETATAELEN